MSQMCFELLYEELTRAKIGMPKTGMVLKKYPELDSRIKALGYIIMFDVCCRLNQSVKHTMLCQLRLHGQKRCCYFAHTWPSLWPHDRSSSTVYVLGD